MDKDESIRLFKALGDTTRFSIIEILLKGPHTVGDLVARLNRSQPAVSIALAKLSQANSVVKSRQGTTIVYSIAEQVRHLLRGVGK